MRFKQPSDNGNVVVPHGVEISVSSRKKVNNSNWRTSNNSDSCNLYSNVNRTDNIQFNSNYNIYDGAIESTAILESTTGTTIENFKQDHLKVNIESVCNIQYRLNTQNSINFINSCNNIQTTNLEGVTETVFSPHQSFLGRSNASTTTTPLDEERAFDQSDTDDMSENIINPVPRGIINPNYPGFQHLAHTLQDYSTNIENFYHSENEMTDDDLDVEITESSYESEHNQNEIPIEYKNICNNNNINSVTKEHTTFDCQITPTTHVKTLDSCKKNEIPDLLKTISKNNNNSTDFDLNYSDTDIENNFHTKDIIGDFNKEIEDEIRELFNYNINIQDDLEELKKDIKDTFTKPIENTINNISDVVNHVIKKLVETHTDTYEQNEKLLEEVAVDQMGEEVMEIENESNMRTEMNLSRPTFLLLENNTDGKIIDAFLSDGKDEINIYENEYDTETLSNNVERTIQQLSTELRKIIPKLDEMRERDKLWTENKKDTASITIDSNSNEIASSSKYCIFTDNLTKEYSTGKSKNETTNEGETVFNKVAIINRTETRPIKDTQKDSSPSCFRSAQNNTSVRKIESARDYELESFDVYNIETALPTLDIDAIESHLKAAKEAERRKRNDREEIRRRLAMGADSEDYYSIGHTDRPGKKPSLHSRLQNGMNLQICFMNETASDNESQTSDLEKNINCNKSFSRSSIFSKNNFNHPYQTRPLSVNITKHDKISPVQTGAKLRPSSLSLKTTKSRSSHSLGHIELKESDFYALQATLQTEARIALAQAKEMARVQMERERRSRSVSPVTEMLRRSMLKANAPLAADRRRVSRQLLTDMNIAQLQVIVNELHSQIESLNEMLVKLLMARDELHMGQDSMLVDIEDLTRYLGVKEQTKKTKGTNKSGVRRLTSLVHK